MMFKIDSIPIYFPYSTISPEQLSYIKETIASFTTTSNLFIEMPAGSGKTICILSAAVSYQLYHMQDDIRFVYCTRTVQESEKTLVELQMLISYVKQHVKVRYLGLGLTSRKHLCVNEEVHGNIEMGCRKLLSVGNCGYYDRIDHILENVDRGDDYAVHMSVGVNGEENIGELSDIMEMSVYDDKVGDNSTKAAGSDPKTEHVNTGSENSSTNNASVPFSFDGVYTFEQIKQKGQHFKFCPYFLTRKALSSSNFLILTYNYVLDPKIKEKINLPMNAILIFDEAHNIDNACLEAFSYEISRSVVNGCSKGLEVMEDMIKTGSGNTVNACASHKEHADRMHDIESLSTFSQKKWPGNLRKDVHVLSILKRILEFLRIKLKSTHLTINTPQNFLCSLENLTFISRRTLSCLKKRFQMIKMPFDENVDKLNVLVDMMDTLSRYAGSNAFSVVFEPFLSNNSLSPKLTLSCNDSRIAMSALKFKSIMITSGTLTPFDVYMRLLGITGKSVSIRGSTKEVLIVSKGNDQINVSSDVSLESSKTVQIKQSNDTVPNTDAHGSTRNAGLANDFEHALLSSSYKLRASSSTIRNYATLIKDLCDVVPDGMIIFFPSYVFMHEIISKCEFMIKKLHKLIFIETINYGESINALANYKRAIKQGRGAIMFCVARGKVSEGIDFKNEEGRCVLLIGVPFAFTESVIIKERLKFLKQNINLNAFLQFDALRHALQCLGRVVRGKNDYGLMVMADYRYNSYKYSDEYDVVDGLSVDMCVNIGKAYFRKMANKEQEKMMDESAVLKLLEGKERS